MKNKLLLKRFEISPVGDLAKGLGVFVSEELKESCKRGKAKQFLSLLFDHGKVVGYTVSVLAETKAFLEMREAKLQSDYLAKKGA